MEKQTIAVKYIGKREPWADRLYDTGLTFATEQVRNVPSETARKLLRHVDLFEQADDKAKTAKTETIDVKADDKASDDTEQVIEQAKTTKAEKLAQVEAVAELHDQVNQMTKDGLEKFAKDKFNIDLDKRSKVDDLKAEVHTLIDRFGAV